MVNEHIPSFEASATQVTSSASPAVPHVALDRTNSPLKKKRAGSNLAPAPKAEEHAESDRDDTVYPAGSGLAEAFSIDREEVTNKCDCHRHGRFVLQNMTTMFAKSRTDTHHTQNSDIKKKKTSSQIQQQLVSVTSLSIPFETKGCLQAPGGVSGTYLQRDEGVWARRRLQD